MPDINIISKGLVDFLDIDLPKSLIVQPGRDVFLSSRDDDLDLVICADNNIMRKLGYKVLIGVLSSLSYFLRGCGMKILVS